MPRRSTTTVRRGTTGTSPFKSSGSNKHQKIVSGVYQDDSGIWRGKSSHQWERERSKSGVRKGKSAN